MARKSRSLQDLRNACETFVKRRREVRLQHQRALVEGVFGDVKASHRGVRSLDSVASSPENLLDGVYIGQINQRPGMHDMDGLQSLEFANSLHLEENNAIWNQFFCDGATGLHWEPGTEREGLQVDWT